MLLTSRRNRPGTALAIGITLTLLLAGSAQAATIQVNSSADPTDGSNCTLRQAIANAENDAQTNASCAAGTGDDTITFADSLFGQTITLDGNELLIDPGAHIGTLTIQGPGAAGLEVSGNDLSRVFHISFNAVQTANQVTIHGLKISHGAVANANGGGILNQGSLILDRDLVSGNTANGSSTGGTTNQVTTFGGGIDNTGGALSVSFTQITGNSVSSTASGGSTSNTATARGAGNHAVGDIAGILNIDHSSIYNNAATAGATGTGAQAIAEGGGVWSSAGAQDSIVSSTIANNTLSATGTSEQETGGGVDTNITLGFAAFLSDDTVTGNVASTGANLAATAMGLKIRNTIVAEPSPAASNCSGITSLGHNLADDNSCQPTGTGDQGNTEPGLLPLDNHGGSGPTRPPSIGSPAIDAGFSDFTTDQRDLTRPWEFINLPDDTSGNGADIGAVEIQGPFVAATDPTSPSANSQPNVIGGAEDGSTIELHATSDCSDGPLGTGTVASFALPGIAPTNPLALGSTTTFHAQSLYGTARSACSPTSVPYTVLAGPSSAPPPPTKKKKCKKGKGKKRAVSAKKKKCKKGKK